jgi:hypothetical protein
LPKISLKVEDSNEPNANQASNVEKNENEAD